MTAPFEFDLNESGFTKLRAELARAEASRNVALTRVGVEQGGHYHDSLVARLQSEGLDVVVLSPSRVKDNRSQNLLRAVKTDTRDLAAMAELMIRGLGRRPELARMDRSPARRSWSPTAAGTSEVSFPYGASAWRGGQLALGVA